MERQPHHEGGEHHHDMHAFAPEERIELGITAAIAGDLVIDPHTARIIGRQLVTEETPALEYFVHSGQLASSAYREIGLMRLDPAVSEQRARWIDWLSGYWLERQKQNEKSGEQLGDAEHGQRYDPRVYVTDLSSLERTIHYGVWIDATQPPADLKADVTAMLDRSPTVGADTWAVGASQGFAGIDVAGFTDPALISRLARGVREHGAAYSAWVFLTGIDNPDQLDKFADFHVGSYDSSEAWIREVTDDLHWREHLDQAVDPAIRPYVSIDHDTFLREAVTRWDVLRGDDGRIHVFLR